jgi:hypothetical protein
MKAKITSPILFVAALFTLVISSQVAFAQSQEEIPTIEIPQFEIECEVECCEGECEGPAPILTVTKVVINDNGGTQEVEDFPLMIEMDATSEVTSDAESVISGVPNIVKPGTYQIFETNEAGYTPSFSGDCNASGQVEMDFGDVKNCILTNNDPGTTGGGGGGGAGGRPDPVTPTVPTTPNEPADVPETTSTLDTPTNKTPDEPETPDESEGEVLGETSCAAYLNDYIHINKQNNPDEVTKLQLFLNEYMGLNLDVNGKYNKVTFEAVKQFQTKEFKEILEPWGITKATGYVYITTRRRINMIKCPSMNIDLPSPLVADTNINDGF